MDAQGGLKKLNLEHSPFGRIKDMTLPRKAGMFSLAFAQKLEQIVGQEELGLKARNLKAWAGASPTSAGPGHPHHKTRKTGKAATNPVNQPTPFAQPISTTGGRVTFSRAGTVQLGGKRLRRGFFAQNEA